MKRSGFHLKFEARPLSFFGLARQVSIPAGSGADPLFGAAWASAGVPRSSRRWNLPLINGLAVAAIIAGVAYRIYEAHLPPDVLRQEEILIGLGVVFGAIAVGLKASRVGNRLSAQLPVMITAAVLADLYASVDTLYVKILTLARAADGLLARFAAAHQPPHAQL